MCRAFPGSDYYEGSVAIGVSPRRQSRVPLTLGMGLGYSALMLLWNQFRFERLMGHLVAGYLLALTAIGLGAGITDLGDRPNLPNAFLEPGWVRELVDGRWWIFLLFALFTYVVRWGLALSYRQSQRTPLWAVPIELVAMGTLAGLTSYGLFRLSLLAAGHSPCC